jgi:magnesium chelatase subunit D
MSELRANESPWRSAILAATAFALDPLGAGIVVRSGPGPARDAWLAHLRAALSAGAPLRRISAAIADDRLLGGLDIAATLKAGRPIAEMGVLAGADGGVLVLAMAERASADLAARLAAVLDTGVVALERDGFALQIPTRVGLVALDEGYGDERPAAAMLERCGYAVDLSAIGMRDIEPADLCAADFDAARARLDMPSLPILRSPRRLLSPPRSLASPRCGRRCLRCGPLGRYARLRGEQSSRIATWRWRRA